jgi:Putative cyclase
VVVDIAAKAARDPDAVVTVADVRAFERRHGRIPHDAAALMYSGWGAKVGDPDAYRGTDAAGTLHFPGFDPDACEWPLRHRGIRSIGVDTLSIDPGNSTTFETHLVLTGADRYGLENLANLDRIPRRGATIMVGLIPYEEAPAARPGSSPPGSCQRVGPGGSRAHSGRLAPAAMARALCQWRVAKIASLMASTGPTALIRTRMPRRW